MNKQQKKKFRQKIVAAEGIVMDASWKMYFVSNEKYHGIIQKRFNWISDRIEGPRVLDIGCGSGLGCFLSAIKPDVETVVGVDLWVKMLDVARENIAILPEQIKKKVQLRKSFAEDLLFPDNHFDTVILCQTLEHVFSPKESVLEARRVMVPQGRLIVTVPNSGKLSRMHLRTFNRDSFRDLISSSFRIVEFGFEEKLYCLAIKEKEDETTVPTRTGTTGSS